jgi:hypothetical protein
MTLPGFLAAFAPIKGARMTLNAENTDRPLQLQIS